MSDSHLKLSSRLQEILPGAALAGAREVIADSRVKNFDHPPYRQIDRRDSCTLPDLDESAEFRDVRIYLADQAASVS